MATDDSSNTSLTSQLTVEALTALSGRLSDHADGIENLAAQAMATDMRLAAQAIEHLLHTKEPADLLVNVYENVDAEPVLSSVPLREVIGDDAEEYDDCRRTLLADGRCTTGGGASPLYHLRRVPNEELIRLQAGIQRAIDSTTDPVCRNHLRELLGGAPASSAKPELVSVTSVKALLNRLLDHGRESGDEALYGDIDTIGRLVFTLWEIIEGAGIKVPTIEMKPAAEGC
jgi:hypothetical protein